MLLALAPLAHALDAAGVAPALEAQFAPTATYLDCPFHQVARTCVLIPRTSSKRSAYADVLAFVRALPGAGSIDRQGAPSSLAFVVSNTSYQLRLDRSRASPGAIAATLSFAFDRQSAFNVACLRTEALFDDARLTSLAPAAYAAMATAIACHGADPVDARSRTPLVMAIDGRNLDAVRALLRGGADPNHITQRGWTPLLFAARDGTPAIVDALLRAGADPSYIAPDGATIGTLEPFNPRLGTASGTLAVSALAPRIPGVLSDAGTRAVATISGPAAGGTPGTSAEGAEAPGAGAPGPAAPDPSTPDPSTPDAAPSGGASRLTVIALELLALVTVASLAVFRFRRHEPGAGWESEPVPMTVPQPDLPAMQVPVPFRRQRSQRRLEPAPGSDEQTVG